MAKSRTKDVDRRLVIRTLSLDDLDAIQELHRRCFPGMEPWWRRQLSAQIERFPEGQIGIEMDGRLVATSSSLIVHGESWEGAHTYDEASDGGHIGTHADDGDTLYGIDIAVDPEFRGMRLARRIYDARKALARERNLRRIFIAGRMPGFDRHAGQRSAEDYVAAVVQKELRDPVLTAQLSNGFAIVRLLTDYLPEDSESRGYAVLMEWLNPAWLPPEVRSPVASRARVASVQYQMRHITSFEEFAVQVEFFADTAADYRCDFLLYPELLTNQLLAMVPASRPALAARRLHEFTDRYLELFRRMAIKHAVNIIGGTHLTVDGDTLYNVAYLFHRDGRIDTQRKLHITPSEGHWWGVSPGTRLEVFETDRGPIAILICYDVEFPELARVARARGAEILFVPYNTDIRAAHLRVRSCAQARCIENHVYVVTSGAVGNLPFVEGADIHYARSAVLTPSDIPFARDGIASEATPNVEAMVLHDLDLDLLRRTLRTGTVRPWADRRLDLYDVVWHGGDDDDEPSP
ncbi:MAG: GNAT family N-acetyltransferase [Deltaproteobacteria bacterium]|nr:GNAT family N-acetyltransferase [Deltaproteobacteria bacterium]MCB9786389.1 GNAT family N-acetyltransferase [Deltaproteobacteria bacterium]